MTSDTFSALVAIVYLGIYTTVIIIEAVVFDKIDRKFSIAFPISLAAMVGLCALGSVALPSNTELAFISKKQQVESTEVDNLSSADIALLMTEVTRINDSWGRVQERTYVAH